MTVCHGAARALATACAAASLLAASGCDRTSDARTEEYIAALDLEEIQRLGSDFTSPRYDPERIGKPRDEIDPVHDYDFERLAEVERRLEGVDRRRVLEHIFAELTEDAETNTQKHLAVLRFLHRCSLHNPVLQPMRPGKEDVFDPLTYLELNEMRCSAVSRLAVDLFEGGGFDGRLVALQGHTTAEVFYDGAWHYVDADNCGGNGLSVIDEDGTIPSWLELSEAPQRIDALPFKYELPLDGGPRLNSRPVRSDRCFFGDASRWQKYIRKTRRSGGRLYAWHSIQDEPVEWTLRQREPVYQPGAVRFDDIELIRTDEGARARITWRPARDGDGDLIGYRVYVSSTPRGWSYSKFAGKKRYKSFWHDTGGWKPEMYDALYRLPPHDVQLLETTDAFVEIDLAGEPLFVTVMPFDEYHERAGKTLYLMSNELRIDPPSSPGVTAAAEASTSPEATAAYIAAIDLEAVQRRGTDYTSPRYDPERIGKPIDEIDNLRDYDFERLAEVERRLEGVDRRRVLEHIFAELTKDAETSTDKHLAVLRFLQRCSVHSDSLRPIRSDGSSVSDPLVMLELNEMRCGGVSRLAVDLFEAGGYPARLVLFGHHIAAEVHYNDGWHHFDADDLGRPGACVRDPDGTIPSWLELYDEPHRIDALPFTCELQPDGRPRTRSTLANSVRCFVDEPGRTGRNQRYLTKSEADPVHAWRGPIETPVEWRLREGRAIHQPGAVSFRSVTLSTGDVNTLARISWNRADDEDGDLLGYRVYVGSQPRGWSYSAFAGESAARPFWHDTGGWKPEMYEALYRLPPHDVALIETAEPTVEIELSRDARVYVTVMPFDAYHERVGKTLYLTSNELVVPRPTGP